MWQVVIFLSVVSQIRIGQYFLTASEPPSLRVNSLKYHNSRLEAKSTDNILLVIIRLWHGQIDSVILISFNVPTCYTHNYIPLKPSIEKFEFELCNSLRFLCDEYNKL